MLTETCQKLYFLMFVVLESFCFEVYVGTIMYP